MSTLTFAVRDSSTMLRRNLLHALRYPSMTIGPAAMPILMLLLFVYVFGGTLGAGLAGGLDGAAYVGYLAPGIIVLAAASGGTSVSVAVNVDMTGGIVNRFRTMAIHRSSILSGHVISGVVQTLVGMVLVVGVALLVGFRPTAGVTEWIAAIALMALVVFAITWMCVALGLIAKSPEAASNTPLIIQLLPFIGSTFVPTDSMPTVMRWIAENQPFTPINETLRGLLTGTPIGGSAITAVTWCLGIALVGYLWSRATFNRDRTR